MNEGWVKLHRAVCESAVFMDAEVLQLWIYLLCNAAYEDRDILYCGKVVHLHKGELITGRKILASKLNTKENKVYRALKLLQELGNITIQSNNKFSIISVINWSKYQEENSMVFGRRLKNQNEQQNNNSKFNNNLICEAFDFEKSTAKQQQNDIKTTTKQHHSNTYKEIKEYKEYKEVGEVGVVEACEDDFGPFAAPTTPTLPEIRNFCIERDSIIDPARFYNYYSRVGWDKCGDWQLKIEEWENNAYANNDRERVEKLKNYRSFEKNDKQVIDLEIFDEAIPG